jgi:methionyl-tRNA formyltransferase
MEKMAIEENDNAGTLHDKLMHLGATLIVKNSKCHRSR